MNVGPGSRKFSAAREPAIVGGKGTVGFGQERSVDVSA